MTRFGLYLAALTVWAVPPMAAFAPLAGQAAESATTPSAQQVQDTGPFIHQLADTVFGILRDKNTSTDKKQSDIHTLFVKSFDVPYISRFVLGRFWNQATDEQKKTYQALFTDYIVKTYYGRLDEFKNTNLQVLGSRPSERSDIFVDSRVSRETGDPVAAEWRVRPTPNGGFKIYDLKIEGISMAVNQRDEFNSVAQSQGIDGLIQLLRERVGAPVTKTSSVN